MVLALTLLACDRPDMINAEVSFVTPEPGEEVCHDALEAEADVSSMIDSGADAALLAFFDDLDEGGEGSILVVSTHALKEGENDGTLRGTVAWEDLVDADGRVLLVADVGDLGEPKEDDRLSFADYDDLVGVEDIWARATVSVKVCGI
jgi:hypothetical protein